MPAFRRFLVLAAVVAGGTAVTCPPPAAAFNPLKLGCTVIGAVSPAAKKACTAVKVGLAAFSALKGLFGGGGGGGSSSSSGSAPASAATTATAALGLAAIGTWVLGGAIFALHETAKVLSHTTAPQLESSWFSSTYWRVAAIAALLTLPFLFAAAVQALIRSDLALLLRAALGYLPLAMLAVAIASPLAMLLLAASDQLSASVSSAAGDASAHFLHVTGITIAALTVLTRSPFMVFFVGLLTVAGAVALWVELLVREAAVYVIMLMLPLVFAALVWPARRIWAIRAVELLVALILSKFAIVAVLSLGGAALGHSQGYSVSGMLAGVVLLGLGVFAPWALLRLIPLAELASSAAVTMRQEGRAAITAFGQKWGQADRAQEWAATTAAMRRDSERGLAPDVDHPGQPAAAGPAGPEGERSGAAGRQADAAGTDAPLPEPEEPELVNGSYPPRGDGGSEPASPPAAPATSPERIPGLPEMWQQDDLSWKPLVLGPEGVSAGPLWSPGGADQPGAHGSRTPPGDAVPGGSDDYDPTPPPQAPPEGRL